MGIDAPKKLDYDIFSAVDLERVFGKRTHNGWKLKLNDHLTLVNCVACIAVAL